MRLLFGWTVGAAMAVFAVLVLQFGAAAFNIGDHLTQRSCDPANEYCVERHSFDGLPVLSTQVRKIEIRSAAPASRYLSFDDPFTGPVGITWRDGDAVLTDSQGVTVTVPRSVIAHPDH